MKTIVDLRAEEFPSDGSTLGTYLSMYVHKECVTIWSIVWDNKDKNNVSVCLCEYLLI